MNKAAPLLAQPSLLIDASIYFFQYYFSMPDNWFSEEGNPTGALYGYTTFLLRLIETEKPQYIAACFDESLGSCFRNQLYPNYKISRPPADELLKFQLEASREITEILGIRTFASDVYEADDLLGSLATRFRCSPTPIAILSRDKDLGQLITREQDFIWDYSKGEKHYSAQIKARFGVYPHQLVDYLALVGDSIDDIPGVPGLGPKTASALLNHHASIAELFANIETLKELPFRGAKQIASKLESYRDQIYLARKLTQIDESVEMNVELRELSWNPSQISLALVAEFCERMGFARLKNRIVAVLDASV